MIRKFREKFINGEKSINSIAGAAFMICCMGLASRLLGLVRDRILASKFGAGDELDIYYAAFKIPDLAFNLLILGTLSAAFVPVFTSLISRNNVKQAWDLANKVLSVGLAALCVFALALFITAPFLVSLITFGFSQEKQEMVVGLTRIMLLSPIILGLSGIFGGILNSFKKFFFYSLAPILYNAGIIIGAVFFTEMWGIKGLAWGVVLGAIFHLLIQLPEVKRCGLKFKFDLDFKDSTLRRVIYLMIPRTMGLAVTQINFLVVTILASTLAAGSLAIFNLANNIQSVPLGMFGIPFAIAAFPVLSGSWAREKKDEFIKNFSQTFRNILFFIIPFSVIFIVLRAQIVRVVLGAGRFDWEDTILTYQALGIFALSLFAQCSIPLLARAFYAIQNTKIPFFTGLISEGLNIVMALMLIGKHGILGLIVAFSISTIFNMILLLIVLRKKVGNLEEKSIISSVWKVMVASTAMALIMQLVKTPVASLVDMQTFLGVFTQMFLSLICGLGIFYITGKLLKLKELDSIIQVLKKRKFSAKVMTEEKRDEVGGIGQ